MAASGGRGLAAILLNIATLGALGERTRIDESEQTFLRDTAEILNERIKSAAEHVGVHFVQVASDVVETAAAESFDGHFPCGGKDPWVYGAVGSSLVEDPIKVSPRSFHPTADGHEAYAQILRQYISNAVFSGADLTYAGLPVNPAPAARSDGQRGATGSSGGTTATESEAERAAGAEDAAAGDSGRDADATRVFLSAQRVTPVGATCGAPFAAPGERVELGADGFAANSAVTFTVTGAKLSGTPLSGLQIPTATADANGRLSVVWAMPDVPAADVDAVPRGYMIEATGSGSAAGQVVARLLQPIVAYPGVAPCAFDDTASTTLGSSVRIPVLANDVAPQGGSLDVSSVQVTPVGDGTFTVSAADGSLTFTPNPGFVGTETTQYRVFDTDGVGVRAEITITVSAGCTITAGAGAVNVEGTDGDDMICVHDPTDRAAFNIIDAKAGDDVILAGDGIDWIRGGAGRDTIYGRDGSDRIDGGPGVDTIYGGGGFDTIYSIDMTDDIRDDTGYEIALAPETSPPAVPVAFDDVVYAQRSETLLIDVLGNDFGTDSDLDESPLSITQAPTAGTAQVMTTTELGAHVVYSAVAVDGVDAFTYQVCYRRRGCATAQVAVIVGTTHCTILGTAGDDTLHGTSGADVICGLDGDDVIYGLNGDDILIGGNGDDTIYGGDETLIGTRDGDDALFGGAGDDSLFGGNGDDTLWGGTGNDTLAGNRRDDVLVGGAGSDDLNGGGEDDALWGGPGDDDLRGHAGDDTLHGGLGDDTLHGGNGDDDLRGGPGDDTLTGHAGADTLWGEAGIDTLRGDTQNDTLWGGPGDDILHGGGHNDNLHGNAGNDALNGDNGDDRLWGYSGDDALNGGAGTDYMDGGGDTDSCQQGESVAQCEE